MLKRRDDFNIPISIIRVILCGRRFFKIVEKPSFINFRSGAFPGKMLLVRIIENNKLILIHVRIG